MSLAAGSRLGPYEISAPIGAGGMGEVYKARDTRLDRSVAIKVLPPEFSADPDRRARFEREAKTIAGLSHPHICTLHDVGEHAGSTYLVMEHLAGEALADRLEKGPLPLDQALGVASEIAEALAAAHRQGIVHRDLKPGNVMLTKSGAKLLDFGLAKLTGHGEEPAAASLASVPTKTRPLTSEGAILGTLQYMAPEQVEGRPADARTDLWALGAVLYEMLTARRAFEGESAAGLIGNIMNTDPPALAMLQPLAPPGIDRLVRRCLAKDPDDRWQNAADLSEHLQALRAGWAAAPSAATSTARPRRTLTMAAGITLTVLVAVAMAWVGFGAFWGRSSEPEYTALTMPVNPALRQSAPGAIAMAPDASGVVYLGTTGEDDSRLFWHELTGSEGWALPGTEGASNPFLDPTGRWLGFSQNGKILKLPLQAGRVPQGSPASPVATVDAVRGAAWGPDGTIVYAKLLSGLWSVAAGGGQPRQLTAPDPAANEFGHAWPSVLPGGRHVIFTILDTSARPERSALAVMSLDTLRVTKVLDGGGYARYLPSGHLVFGRSGTILAVPFDLKTLKTTGSPVAVLNDVWFYAGSNASTFDVANDGTLVYGLQRAEPASNSLIWVDREGQEERVAERQPYRSAEVSPDGQRLAVWIDGSPYESIAIYDLRDERWQRLNVAADCNWPVWSPSGELLLFTSNLDGLWNLDVMRWDGDAPPERLTTATRMQIPSAWLDEESIAFQEQAANKLNTLVLSFAIRDKPSRWGPEGAVWPTFSPDRRWVAYESNESGGPEVWVRPFAGPGQRQVVSGGNGGYAPVWSKDGNEIFYLERLRDARLMSRPVESRSPLRLGPPRVAFAVPFVFDFAPLFGRMYSVAPDGRRVLLIQPDDRAPSVVNALQVIRNWPQEVKAKLSAR